MPLMHSEALEDQEVRGALGPLPRTPRSPRATPTPAACGAPRRAQALVQLVRGELQAASAADGASPEAKGWAGVLPFAEAHRDVVSKYGRFPHRNAVLGRPNSPEEEAGLADGSIPRW